MNGKMLTHEQCAKSNGVYPVTVSDMVPRYASGNIRAIIEFKRNINSGNAKRKVDECTEGDSLNLLVALFQKGISDEQSLCLKKKPKLFWKFP